MPPRAVRIIIPDLSFVVLIGVLPVVLSQCTQVSEHMTGVGFGGTNPAQCVKQCNDQASQEVQAEQDLHQANIDQCQALPEGPDRDTCLSTEEQRHEAAMDAINGRKTDCINSCHRQGSGSNN